MTDAVCPHAGFALPWDDAAAPPPVDALRAARRDLGDTFTIDSGTDSYLFLFSDDGLRSFYALPEREASKGLADYQMLLRKLPPEVFDGRRTFAHDLFGAQDVEQYLDRLDSALELEDAMLGSAGTFDAFALARRLGHRLGLSCWIGSEAVDGRAFDQLVSDMDQLDGAESFVHPETLAEVRRTEYASERAALARVEAFVGEVLRSRAATASGAVERGDFLGRIAERWDGVDEPERTRGIAYDVVLLHVATMTNMVAALGWTLARIVSDPDALRLITAGDRDVAERCALEAIRLGQRSIMMRTALRPTQVRVAPGDDGVVAVDRGTIVATMVPITNIDAAATLTEWRPDRWIGRTRSGPDGLSTPEQVTTFGHGTHRCPARRFSMTAMTRTVIRLASVFELAAEFEELPGPLPQQVGGVGRADGPVPISYQRR